MKREIVIFWVAALGIALGLLVFLYRYAAVPAETLANARVPQPMESMADLNLGKPYGTVSVSDLVGYYIEHPPAPKDGAAPEQSAHGFGGC